MDASRAMHDRTMKQISSSRLVGSGVKFLSSHIATLYFAYTPGVTQMVSMDTATLQPKQIRQGAYDAQILCSFLSFSLSSSPITLLLDKEHLIKLLMELDWLIGAATEDTGGLDKASKRDCQICHEWRTLITEK